VTCGCTWADHLKTDIRDIGRPVESESEGILGGAGVGRNFRWSRSRKEFLGGFGVGRNFRWSRSRKEFLGGVGVGRNFRWSRSQKEF
jgi:hypothetical protein